MTFQEKLEKLVGKWVLIRVDETLLKGKITAVGKDYLTLSNAAVKYIPLDSIVYVQKVKNHKHH